MLKNQWQAEGLGFEIAAVNDREPVAADDDLVVLAAPDPQSERLTSLRLVESHYTLLLCVPDTRSQVSQRCAAMLWVT